MRESVDSKYSKLEEAITSQRQEVTEEIHRLESSITKQSDVANTELLHKINSNQEMINRVLIRNDSLEKENMALKERSITFNIKRLYSLVTGKNRKHNRILLQLIVSFKEKKTRTS